MEIVMQSFKYLAKKLNCCKSNHRTGSNYNLTTDELEVTKERPSEERPQDNVSDSPPLNPRFFAGTPKTSLQKSTGFTDNSIVALWEAFDKSDTLKIKNLLEDINDIDLVQYNDEGITLLHKAAIIGNVEILENLLERMPIFNINCTDQSLKTPLHWACISGQTAVVKFLLDSGALVNATDSLSNTALHYAVIHERAPIIEYIFSLFPNLEIKNNEGMTAVDLLKQKGITCDTNQSVALTISECEEIEGEFNLSIPDGIVRSNKNVSLDDFEMIQILGKGSFGEVFLSRLKNTESLYAIKVLRKEKIFAQNLQRYVLTERNVLSYIKHPFIVGLRYAFQNHDKLFLILQYCPGGNLSNLISRNKKLSEEVARVYLCEILLAISELHRRDIIYRDLKPENVVLDETGHALLTDFGLSKEGVLDDVSTNSFCGSIAYLAPEMIKRQGHGKAVDWYLFGVIFYEMVVGRPPYYSSSRETLLDNIQNAKLKIPPRLSEEAKDLLKRLLKRNPASRIGTNGDAEEIKTHPFFQDVNWEDVYAKKLKPLPPQITFVNKGHQMYHFNLERQDTPTMKFDGWTFVEE